MLDLGALKREHGDRTALDAGEVRISYDELAERVAGLEDALAERGVAAGQRVALVCEATPDAIVQALALLSLGCPLLPLDPTSTSDEVGRYARVFGAAWQGRAGGEVALEAVEAAAAGPGDDRPALAFLSSGSAGKSDGRPALAFLSSGSSGTPKLVLRSAGQEAAGWAMFASTMGLSVDDRVLGLVSLGHSFGFNRVALGTLAAGARLVLPVAGHPRAVVERIVESGTTIFAAPPALLDLMTRFQRGARRPLATLRAVLAAGGSVSRRTWEGFAEVFGIAPWVTYGASEAGPITLNRSGAVGEDGVMALGRPHPGVEVSLVDSRGEPVRDGEPGEIVVRSAAVGLGYLGGAEGASRIERGRFFTGDVGVRRDGELYFVGRKKHLIAMAGRKVNPEEVEQVLRRHPDVADAAALGRDAGGVKVLVLARRPVSAADLIAFCGRSLAAYKVPREVEFRDTLPRSALGKLLRDRLD